MKKPIHSLGIDYGGSWIRFFAVNRNGEKVRFIKNPSIPIEKLSPLIKKILKKWKVKEMNSLVVGAKGVWKKNKRKSLKQKLKGLAKNVIVISDVEMAYQSTLRNGPGILILAGTGSIAYGKDKCDHWARAGGLGPLKGDEGSSYWIGSQWIRLKKIRMKERSIREIASLSPIVIKKAKRGDQVAGGIIQEAQDHLARLVIQVIRQLHFKDEIAVGCSGGLFKSLFFRKSFFKFLKNEFREKKVKMIWNQKGNLTANALF